MKADTGGKYAGSFKCQPAGVDPGHMRVRPNRRTERGASLVEYGVVFALIVISSLVAIETLTTESGDYLSSTGDDIGEPREHISDMDTDLPDPPAWVGP
jgi:Flp pilus assembly pilin Flp